MSIKALYPTVRPTLDLNFARLRRLDPRITYTRASTGTFVGSDGLIQTAASGAARFDHNPETGESLGLLVEEARINTLRQSQSIGISPWGVTELVVQQNAAVAPDGTSTATSLVATVVNSTHRVSMTSGGISSTPTNEPYRFSCYFKFNGHRYVGFYCNINQGTYGHFDLLNGTAAVGSIQSVGNGWYRCISTQYPANAGNINNTLSIALGTSNSGFSGAGISFVGDGVSSLLIWGAQSEAGTFPTSYIPTVASTVTRAADLASMTGTNFSSWYRQDQGTIYQSVKLLAASPQDNQYYGATFSAVTDATTRVAHDYSSLGGGASARTIILSDAGATSATLVILPFNATTRKTASAMQVGSVAFAANGQIVTGTATAMPSTVDRMFLSKSGFTPNTTISRFAYYPVRLPDAQLQTITL